MSVETYHAATTLRTTRNLEMDPGQLLEIGIHEASHAIVAYVLLRRPGGPLALTTPFLEPAVACAVPLPRFRYPGAWVEAEVQVLLAGVVGEVVIGSSMFGGEMTLIDAEFLGCEDVTEARGWLAATGITDEHAQDRRLRSLLQRTRHLLVRADVRAAVDVLVERHFALGVSAKIRTAPNRTEVDWQVMHQAHRLVHRIGGQHFRRLSRRVEAGAIETEVTP